MLVLDFCRRLRHIAENTAAGSQDLDGAAVIRRKSKKPLREAGSKMASKEEGHAPEDGRSAPVPAPGGQYAKLKAATKPTDQSFLVVFSPLRR